MSAMQLLSIPNREFMDKRDELGRFLLELYYGKGAWDGAGFEDLQLNYRLDAEDILLPNPHLLSLRARVVLWRSEIMRAQIIDRLELKAIEAQGMAGTWTSFYDDMRDETEGTLVDGRFGDE